MKRLVVCIDVEGCSLKDAYQTVRRLMDEATEGACVEWESSDEWYDDDGGAGDPEALQAARMEAFADEEWTCTECGQRVEASLVRRHRDQDCPMLGRGVQS